MFEPFACGSKVEIVDGAILGILKSIQLKSVGFHPCSLYICSILSLKTLQSVLRVPTDVIKDLTVF